MKRPMIIPNVPPERAADLLRTLIVSDESRILEFKREFEPKLASVSLQRLDCTLHGGRSVSQPGHLLLLSVGRSDRVHSLRGGGTYARLERGNKQSLFFIAAKELVSRRCLQLRHVVFNSARN